jgi:hypothetical protein
MPDILKAVSGQEHESVKHKAHNGMPEPSKWGLP